MDGPIMDAPDLAAFSARYRGALAPADALRWARDPSTPASDGAPSPAVTLERRRHDLYRGDPDPAAAAAFELAVRSWDRELALARAALPERAPVPAAAPSASAPPAAPHRRRRALLVGSLGGVAVVAAAIVIALLPHPAPRDVAGNVAAGVPGEVVARASAGRGARSGSGLDGADRFVTVVVTCQGDGHVEVRLSDGTDARFACISAFPRTAVQPSDRPLRRFAYTVTVVGTRDWAMTLSR